MNYKFELNIILTYIDIITCGLVSSVGIPIIPNSL